MKVALLSTNDITGGAAIVTLRLTRALRQAGVDAVMVAARTASDSPYVIRAAGSLRHKAPFLAERLQIFLNNGLNRRDLFKVDTASFGLPLWRHRAVRQADIVIVSWVNQGMLSLDTLLRIARQKPVIIVMHDMWWLTGICHHSGDCTAYRSSCGHCPMLGDNASTFDLSRRIWQKKKEIYPNPNIHFVAVSSWLAEKCAESPLLADREIHVIPTAFPVEEFTRGPFLSRSELGLPQEEDNRDIILMGAARLDDPIKGLPLAVKALNELEEQGNNYHPVFFGALKDQSALDDLAMPFTWLGPVSDPQAVRSLYHHARFVMSSSLYETLPTTLIEGQASGCWPVSFDRGGQRDIITQGETGWLAPYPDFRELARGVMEGEMRMHFGKVTPARLRESVAAKFSEHSVAQRYRDLFKVILNE